MTDKLTARDLALVDAIATRVVQLLDERERLVDARALAGLLGISRETVYQHAERLGAVEIGDGKRPRLRFDVDVAREAWSARVGSKRSEVANPPVGAGARRRRRSAATQPATRLLPIGPKRRADGGERGARQTQTHGPST